ncbi:MAG: patatin-like phospholipase family protein [Verrucomicrobiota bacterium]|jgi:patatin-like phospholipase/acyl hydrolase
MYKILSFDGGGIRGIVTLTLLQRLEQQVPGFVSRADFYAGTSTGGIIALGLAAGKSIQELLDLYMKNGKQIFDDSWLKDIVHIGDIIGAKYDQKGLEKILGEEFGNLTLAQLNKRVLIPSFDLDYVDPQNPKTHSWSPKFFHNFPGTDSDGKQSVVDVALDTSAAPTYFPAHDGFIDGGVLANNPTMAAVAQTQDSRAQIKPRPALNELLVLSVGTGTVLNFIKGKDNDWGIAQWAQPLINLLLDASMGIADYQCRQILRNNYRRLAPDFPPNVNIKLDEWQRAQDLVDFANKANLGDIAAWLKQTGW